MSFAQSPPDGYSHLSPDTLPARLIPPALPKPASSPHQLMALPEALAGLPFPFSAHIRAGRSDGLHSVPATRLSTATAAILVQATNLLSHTDYCKSLKSAPCFCPWPLPPVLHAAARGSL